MNKQEVLEELETTSTQFFHVATSTGVEANNKTLSTGVFAGLGIAKSVLTKLEEPQKVKVPTFVAEYFNYCIVNERTLAEALSGLDRDFKIPDFLYPAIKWLEDSINQNIFAQAWLYGYEVEEEPKYYIRLTIPNSSVIGLYLGFNKDGKFDTSYGKPHITWGWKCRFTEKEIKAIDERYWPFAVPVEKV